MDPMTMMSFLQQAHNSLYGGLSGIGEGLGLYGDSSEPYKNAEDTLHNFYNQSKGFQNPFLNMGTSAIPQMQDWLKGMQDPSSFINNLMGKYQESPWAKFQQQQAIRSAQNMGSQSGLTGSTPLTQFAQQNAQNISSQDMNQWLQNVLGINTQYGQGLGNEISGGQNAANTLTNAATGFGEDIAGMRYNEKAAENNQRGNLWGGIFNLI